MYLTNYAEKQILGMFQGNTVQAPTLFVALFLSSPGNTGAGTEVSYPGYEHVPAAFTEPALVNGVYTMKNAGDLTFAVSSASVGTATYLALIDSQVPGSGNMWAYMELDEPIAINANVAPSIVAQEWAYQFTGDFTAAYKQKILNLLRGHNITGFTPFYAPYNGNPDSGGAELSGGLDGNYARFAAGFTAPAVQPSGQTMITQAVDTGSVRPSGAGWGTWSHTSIMTAESGGEAVCYKAEPATNILSSNRRMIVPAGGFSILLN